MDRVVAVVGDTVILESELQEEFLQLQAMGAAVPREPEAIRDFLRQILEQRIDELVVLLRARKEGITVTEAEANEAVEDRLAQVRRRFGSETEFLRALEATGRTLTEFRLQTTEEVRNELLIQRYLQSHGRDLSPEPVSEREIEEFFQAQKAALGPKPPTVSFTQVVVRPQPSEEAKATARAKAEQALAEARAGTDFTIVARRYSDDAATRDEGGDLGWFRRGMMVRPFEEAVYRLRPGELSEIVESPFGYHIIKLDRVRGGERRARHVLIRPPLNEADIERARALADSIADVLRAGTSTAVELAQRFGDPEEQVEVKSFPRDRMPREYAEALADATSGDIAGPFRIRSGASEVQKLAVLTVTALEPGGEWTLADVRENVRAQLQQDKALRKFVRKLREGVYVDVRW